MSSNSSNKKRSSSRRCKRESGQAKYDVIRIKGSVRNDLQFIKVIVGISANIPDGEVVETLVKMFKQKKIGQLIDGKNYKIPLDSDLVTFFNDKDAQKTIKEYEYLLHEKQSTLDNYIKYLDTTCQLAKVDKVHVIEIVRNKNSYKRLESINNSKILD
jgi:hypothetical protein